MTLKVDNSKIGLWNGRKFRNEKSIVVLIWTSVFVALWVYLFVIFLHPIAYLNLFYAFIAFVFLYFLIVVSVQGQSDLTIGDDGISRNAFGIVWQKMQWSNMRYIKVFDSYKPTEKYNKSFNILPIKKPFFGPFGSKIAFDDKMERWPEFVEILNRYIEQYHIRIESTAGGVAASPTRL